MTIDITTAPTTTPASNQLRCLESVNARKPAIPSRAISTSSPVQVLVPPRRSLTWFTKIRTFRES